MRMRSPLQIRPNGQRHRYNPVLRPSYQNANQSANADLDLKPTSKYDVSTNSCSYTQRTVIGSSLRRDRRDNRAVPFQQRQLVPECNDKTEFKGSEHVHIPHGFKLLSQQSGMDEEEDDEVECRYDRDVNVSILTDGSSEGVTDPEPNTPADTMTDLELDIHHNLGYGIMIKKLDDNGDKAAYNEEESAKVRFVKIEADQSDILTYINNTVKSQNCNFNVTSASPTSRPQYKRTQSDNEPSNMVSYHSNSLCGDTPTQPSKLKKSPKAQKNHNVPNKVKQKRHKKSPTNQEKAKKQKETTKKPVGFAKSKTNKVAEAKKKTGAAKKCGTSSKPIDTNVTKTPQEKSKNVQEKSKETSASCDAVGSKQVGDGELLELRQVESILSALVLLFKDETDNELLLKKVKTCCFTNHCPITETINGLGYDHRLRRARKHIVSELLKRMVMAVSPKNKDSEIKDNRGVGDRKSPRKIEVIPRSTKRLSPKVPFGRLYQETVADAKRLRYREKQLKRRHEELLATAREKYRAQMSSIKPIPKGNVGLMHSGIFDLPELTSHAKRDYDELRSSTSLSIHQCLAVRVVLDRRFHHVDLMRLSGMAGTRTIGRRALAKAYKIMLLKLHPDKNPHPKAAEAFNKVHQKYTSLVKEHQ